MQLPNILWGFFLFSLTSYLWQVEKVVSSSHPDLLELSKAKKMLKVNWTQILEFLQLLCWFFNSHAYSLFLQEHEQTLIDVIAKLSDACDSGSGKMTCIFHGWMIEKLSFFSFSFSLVAYSKIIKLIKCPTFLSYIMWWSWWHGCSIEQYDKTNLIH